MNPSKRVAIITGASSGLGREFARQLDARQVADELWLVARNEKALTDVAGELDTPSRAVAADLTSEADIANIRATLSAEDPRVTFLVNAAGFGKFGDWQTISDAAVDSMIDLNCRGLVDMTRATLPYMERGSRIIQVASAAAFTPLPHMNVYAATKSFVLHYTRALRWELHGTGITATALCPTWVKIGFEKVARTSGGGHDVGHLLGEQTPQDVVRRALCANKAHFAVACASPQSAALRLIGKVVPSCITRIRSDMPSSSSKAPRVPEPASRPITTMAASSPPTSFQLVISSSKTSLICIGVSSLTLLSLFSASTYPSSITLLLNRPNASVKRKSTISRIVILVTKPLQVNIPSIILSKTFFIPFDFHDAKKRSKY